MATSTPISVQGGRLVIENDDAGILRGCEIALAEIPVDRIIRIAFDIEITAGAGQIHVGGLQTSGGSWATTTETGDPTWAISASGHYELVFTSGNATGNPRPPFLSAAAAGHLVARQHRHRMGRGQPAGRSPGPIDSGAGRPAAPPAYAGSWRASREPDVRDGGGRQLFTRSHQGDAVAVPYATLFIPEDAATRNIQWLWAGRNNADTPDIGPVDIAAMTDVSPATAI
jgi:hypothetical protein